MVQVQLVLYYPKKIHSQQAFSVFILFTSIILFFLQLTTPSFELQPAKIDFLPSFYHNKFKSNACETWRVIFVEHLS